jgi:hypothetical protein
LGFGVEVVRGAVGLTGGWVVLVGWVAGGALVAEVGGAAVGDSDGPLVGL